MAHLIPKCRAELVDSGYLRQPDLRRRIQGAKLWRVTFDTVCIARQGTPDSILRKLRPRRCELFFGARDANLILVSLYMLGSDTSNIPSPEQREIEIGEDSLIGIPTPLNLQSALSKALCQPFASKLVECVCAMPMKGSSDKEGPYWWICAHSVEFHSFFASGRRNGRQSTCIDATTGGFRCGLSGQGEGWFLPDSAEICRLAMEWTGFQGQCFEGLATACRAMRIDGRVLGRTGWERSTKGQEIWTAVFDTVFISAPSTAGSPVDASVPFRCELFFDPRSEALLMVKVMEVGFDTTTVALPSLRRFGLDSGYLSNEPGCPTVLMLLTDAECRQFAINGVLEAVKVSRRRKLGMEDMCWILYRHGEVLVPHEGTAVGGEKAEYDALDGKFQRVGSPWRERFR